MDTSYIQQWALAQLRNNPISDPFQNAFSHFMWELSARHSGRSVCFSAVQKFVVEYQGQSMVYTLLAVLREEKDVSDQADPSGNWDRSFHFRFALDDEPHESSAVSNLLNLQVSARHFQDERSKSAIWTFGALSPGDRFVESSTFRWLKQQRLDVATKYVLLYSKLSSSQCQLDSDLELPSTLLLETPIIHCLDYINFDAD
jgi:hypothetical protein